MSLSDKFYEGLSAPLPVAGAQMPTDLVPYAGGPLDALEQHLHKYKQLDYMNRLSDKASKRLLKQLAKAETEYGEEEMDKMSFVGSDPLSRRAYYLQKLAENPPPPARSPADPTSPPPADPTSPPPADPTSPPPADPTSPPPAPEAPLSRGELVNINKRNDELGLPRIPVPIEGPTLTAAKRLGPAPVQSKEPPPSSTPNPPPPTEPKSFGQRYVNQRFLGQGRQDLVNSGEFLNRTREMSNAFQRMDKSKRPIRQPEDTRSFFERAKDNLYHYGTRAARGLSTGAQMGASYLYDVADRNNYLDEGSFLGDTLGKENRQSLNREMARINASLGHAYGGKGEDADLYFKRLRGIDTDLSTKGTQDYGHLANRDKFRQELVDDRVLRSMQGRNFTADQINDLRRGAEESVDNYYGFKGNTAGTPSIGQDITGTRFRNAMNELRAGSLVNSVDPAKQQVRVRTLQEMMSNPEVYQQIEQRFGQEASKAGVPLAQYAASQLASGLQYTDPRRSTASPEAQLENYNKTRELTTTVLDNMNAQDRGNFLSMMNPRVIQRAQSIAQMTDEDALAAINDMDPLEARYLMDQYALLSKYVSPDMAQTTLDPSQYRVLEDRDDWLPSFGGVDLVNPALQQIGAGSDLEDMTGDARDSVYFFNSMREQPAADGQFFLVDKGPTGNTYYNPITGEVNFEAITDMGRLFSSGSPDTHIPLPEQFHKQFREQEGYLPTYTGR